MTNYSAKILNNSIRSLNAQQAIIANTSNNIANVNTQGYSRRVVNLETASDRSMSTSGIKIGNGVQISGVQRMASEFLTKMLQDASGKSASSTLQEDYLGRIDKLFNLTEDGPSITKDLNAFFNALNDLTVNPSSIEARKVVIAKAQELVTSIGGTYEQLAAMQDEADRRVATEIQQANALLAQIAETNTLVTNIEQGNSGTEAVDARDQRERLLRSLSEKFSFQTVENNDGSINVYLNNGFTLVSGANSYALTVTNNPSFAGGTVPPSLSGGTLNYITYDYSGGLGTADFDLTQVLKDGEGSVGALLKVRGYNDPSNISAFQADGSIVEVASRVEALARDLLERFNTTYLGADEDSGTAGFQPNALDLDGNTPPVYGFFDFTYSGAKDANSNGLPDDLSALPIDSFARVLTVRSTDPRAFAAARDQDATNASLALVAGNGDNVQALVALSTASTTFSAGNYSFTGTFNDAYNETVAHVSSLKGSISSRALLDKNQLLSAQAQRDEVAAVSLDEEFANLIKFQKAYQASARMIKVAEDLMDQILQLI
jgi:flagellar hook-associated protein 1 FlgK